MSSLPHVRDGGGKVEGYFVDEFRQLIQLRIHPGEKAQRLFISSLFEPAVQQLSTTL